MYFELEAMVTFVQSLDRLDWFRVCFYESGSLRRYAVMINADGSWVRKVGSHRGDLS